MSIVDNTVKAVRMAGTNLGQYLTSPQTAQALGRKVALDTALGVAVPTAVSYAVGAGAPDYKRLAKQAAVHSMISSPVSGGLTAMGMNPALANAAGSVAAAFGTSALSRPVATEPFPEQRAALNQHMMLRRLAMEEEQQRYNNEIALAHARNSRAPETTVIHRNPSAEFATMQQFAQHALNPNVQYG
jgi:hypothetical protein